MNGECINDEREVDGIVLIIIIVRMAVVSSRGLVYFLEGCDVIGELTADGGLLCFMC